MLPVIAQSQRVLSLSVQSYNCGSKGRIVQQGLTVPSKQHNHLANQHSCVPSRCLELSLRDLPHWDDQLGIAKFKILHRKRVMTVIFSSGHAGVGGKQTVLDEAEEVTWGIMSASVKPS